MPLLVLTVCLGGDGPGQRYGVGVHAGLSVGEHELVMRGVVVAEGLSAVLPGREPGRESRLRLVLSLLLVPVMLLVWPLLDRARSRAFPFAGEALSGQAVRGAHAVGAVRIDAPRFPLHSLDLRAPEVDARA